MEHSNALQIKTKCDFSKNHILFLSSIALTNISQSSYLQDGGKINWHRYGTKIRHCHPTEWVKKSKLLNMSIKLRK